MAITGRRRGRRFYSGSAGTSFDSLVATYSPIIDYKFDEASGDLLNNGSGTLDVQEVTAVNTRSVANGDVVNPGSMMNWDQVSGGTEGFRNDGNHAAITGRTSGGSVIVVFRTSATTGSKVMQDSLGSSPFVSQFRVIMEGGANGHLKFQYSDISINAQAQTPGAGNIVNDGNYHVIVCTQPVDGGGFHIYKDADGDVTSTTSYSGTGAQDAWYGNINTMTEWTIGHGENNINPYGGDFDRFIITDTKLGASDCTALYNAYLGL